MRTAIQTGLNAQGLARQYTDMRNFFFRQAMGRRISPYDVIGDGACLDRAVTGDVRAASDPSWSLRPEMVAVFKGMSPEEREIFRGLASSEHASAVGARFGDDQQYVDFLLRDSNFTASTEISLLATARKVRWLVRMQPEAVWG